MLQEIHNREIHYLRLSLTNRCNFRCRYCQPREPRALESPKDWLTIEEIERVVAQFAALGVSHVRLAGGEPLLRPDLSEIAQRITALPAIEQLSLSTNGSHLAAHAAELRRAGVEQININLDSLNEANFNRITGAHLQSVLAGIDAAKAQAFPSIKINMVVMRDINDYEVEAMIDYCLDHGLALRLIETAPQGDSGRRENEHYLPMSEIEERIRLRHGLSPLSQSSNGPARYMRIDDSELVVGFISSQSQQLCESCNRVRLSVNGDVHPCLGQNDLLALRPLLRKGASDTVIQKAIHHAISCTPERQQVKHIPLSARG